MSLAACHLAYHLQREQDREATRHYHPPLQESCMPKGSLIAHAMLSQHRAVVLGTPGQLDSCPMQSTARSCMAQTSCCGCSLPFANDVLGMLIHWLQRTAGSVLVHTTSTTFQSRRWMSETPVAHLKRCAFCGKCASLKKLRLKVKATSFADMRISGICLLGVRKEGWSCET